MSTFALFLTAAIVGVADDRKPVLFYGLLVLVFISIVAMWNVNHDWPGFFTPAFADNLSTWVLVVIVGLFCGGKFNEFFKKRSHKQN